KEFCGSGSIQRCVPKKPNGSPCDTKEECLSSICENNFCLPRCDSDGDCPSVQYCSSERCTNKVPSGSGCTEDKACLNGPCINDICRTECQFDNQCDVESFCNPQSFCEEKRDPGEACENNKECKGVCAETGCSNGCTTNKDCLEDQFCVIEERTCRLKKKSGERCGESDECISKSCVFGICACSKDIDC
ncbi:unnamed protein product, partial [Owenia fusiformis]